MLSTEVESLVQRVSSLKASLIELRARVAKFEEAQVGKWWYTIRGFPEVLLHAYDKKATYPVCVLNSWIKSHVLPTKEPTEAELETDWNLVQTVSGVKVYMLKEETDEE